MAKHIITSYCVTRDHWILAAVVAKQNKVFYLDSLKISMENRKDAYHQFVHLIQEWVPKLSSPSMAIILAFILIWHANAYCFQSRRAFNTYVKRGGAHEEGLPIKLHHDSKF